MSTATMSTVTTTGILSGLKIRQQHYQSFTRILLTALLCELYNKLLLNSEQFCPGLLSLVAHATQSPSVYRYTKIH